LPNSAVEDDEVAVMAARRAQMFVLKKAHVGRRPGMSRWNERRTRVLSLQPAQGRKGFSEMNKFMLPATAIAVCLASAAAFAQSATENTTTTETTPSGTTQTTTMQSNDGYQQYRRTITTTKHYDAGAFVAPSGYTYTRYAIGQHVKGDLLGNNYVLTGYGTYELQAPPSGLTWIRVGDDALLVDRKTGEVVESDYGLFKS
jgi:Ni/Co efflux regulator RcnB